MAKISWSQLKEYIECGRKWQLDYVEDLAPPTDNIHTVGGDAFHESIQWYIKRLDEGKDLDSGDLKSKFIVLLKEKGEEIKKSDDWEDRIEEPVTKKQLMNYASEYFDVIDQVENNISKYFDFEKYKVIDTEEVINKKITDNIQWIGYIDLLLQNKETGKYVIIDIKTSSTGWDKFDKEDEKKANQVIAYKYMYSDMEKNLDVDPSDIETYYWIFARNKSKYVRHDIEKWDPMSHEDRKEDIQEKIQNFIDEAFDEDGNPVEETMEMNPGKFKCCWCPFSKQFNKGKDYAVCNQNGERFDDYPSGMKGYISDKWIG